jgi:hypothetical protein
VQTGDIGSVRKEKKKKKRADILKTPGSVTDPFLTPGAKKQCFCRAEKDCI